MYIDTQFRAAKLPARSPQARFSGPSFATSLLVHALLAAGLILLAHNAVLREPAPATPIPMIFLPAPPPPAPAPPVRAEPPPVPAVEPLPSTPPPPPKVEPPLPAPTAERLPIPPLPPPPPPIPKVAPAPPPPVVKQTRPAPRPKVEHRRATPRRERRPPEQRRPLRREPPRAPAMPEAFAPAEVAPAPRPAPPVAMETGPVIPPRPLSAAAGNRPPSYPDAAKRRREQGMVVLRVAVTADGRAGAVSIVRSSGFGRLDQSAAEAVRGWRFIPATRGGRPIPGIAQVPVNFHLAGE